MAISKKPKVKSTKSRTTAKKGKMGKAGALTTKKSATKKKM